MNKRLYLVIQELPGILLSHTCDIKIFFSIWVVLVSTSTLCFVEFIIWI